MKRTSKHLIQKCRKLRRQGIPLGGIMDKTNLPKTTVYKYIKDIPLPQKVIERIKQENKKCLKKYTNQRKGVSTKNRHPKKFKSWTPELIQLVAHLIFDGEIKRHHCSYSNSNKVLINRVRNLMKEVYDYNPSERDDLNHVSSISYFNVELAAYIKKKSKDLLIYIKTAPKEHKRAFLKSFFDDEGSVGNYKNNRKVRGYQHNLKILKLIQNLLLNFDIESTIENKNREIVMRRKENLIKFQEEINFSKGIYINPNRKNSVWKEKLEKRKILEKAINSYQNLNREY